MDVNTRRRSIRRSSVRTPLKEVKAHVDNALMAVLAVVGENENPFATKSRLLRTPPPSERKENGTRKSTGGKKRQSISKEPGAVLAESALLDSEVEAIPEITVASTGKRRKSLSKGNLTPVAIPVSQNENAIVGAVCETSTVVTIVERETPQKYEPQSGEKENIKCPENNSSELLSLSSMQPLCILKNDFCEPPTHTDAVFELTAQQVTLPSPFATKEVGILPIAVPSFPTAPVFEEMVNLSIAMIDGSSVKKDLPAPRQVAIPPPLDALSRYLLHPKEFIDLLKSFRSPPKKKITSERKSSEKKVLRRLSSDKKSLSRMSIGKTSPQITSILSSNESLKISPLPELNSLVASTITTLPLYLSTEATLQESCDTPVDEVAIDPVQEIPKYHCENPFKSTRALPRTPAATVPVEKNKMIASPVCSQVKSKTATFIISPEVSPHSNFDSCVENEQQCEIVIAEAFLEPRRKSIEVLRRESGQSRRLPRGSLSGPVYNYDFFVEKPVSEDTKQTVVEPARVRPSEVAFLRSEVVRLGGELSIHQTFVTEARDERQKLEERIAILEALITRKEQLETETKQNAIEAFSQQLVDIDMEILANLEFLSSTTIKEKSLLDRAESRRQLKSQMNDEIDTLGVVTTSTFEYDFESVPVDDYSVEKDENFEIAGEFSMGRSSMCSINCSPVNHLSPVKTFVPSNISRAKRGATGKVPMSFLLEQTNDSKPVATRLTFVPIIKKGLTQTNSMNIQAPSLAVLDSPSLETENNADFQDELVVIEPEETNIIAGMNFVPIVRRQKKVKPQVTEMTKNNADDTKKGPSKQKLTSIVESAVLVPAAATEETFQVEETKASKKSKKNISNEVSQPLISSKIKQSSQITESVKVSKSKSMSSAKRKQNKRKEFLDDAACKDVTTPPPASAAAAEVAVDAVTVSNIDKNFNTNADEEAAAFERFSAANLKEVKMMKPKAKKNELDSLLKNMWSVATEAEKVQWLITKPAPHDKGKVMDLFPPSPEVKKSRKKDAAPSKKATVAPADTFSVPTLTSMNQKLTTIVNPRVQTQASTSLLNSSISTIASLLSQTSGASTKKFVCPKLKKKVQ